MQARKHIVIAVSLLTVALAACSRPATSTTEAPAAAAPVANAVEAQEQANLANFDDLDYNVFSGQKWEEFPKSHAADIVVHWPDGRTTTGLEPHIADLKQMFVYAPDTRIKEHPIRIAQGDYTAVMGVMEGTFTAPMPTPDGRTIAPTNKPFRLHMATIGRWENGVMKEEWLFWDNHAFMKQIGLAE